MMPVFIAQAIKGTLELGMRLLQDVKEHPNARYTIERIVPKRSINQNDMYWAYLNGIELETGQSAKDMHELYKRMFIPPEIKTVFGKTFKTPGSTKNLNKTEFSEYLAKVEQETGYPLPTEAELEAMGYISNKKIYH